MKRAVAFGLCATSAVLGGIAGIYGGIYLDRRAGDAYGMNSQANELATTLKVASGVLFVLNKGDIAEAQKLLRMTMVSTKDVMEDVSRFPNLTPMTRMRMEEAMRLAARAEGVPVPPPTGPR